MFEDWKGKLLLVVTLAALVVAVALGIQNARLKRDLGGTRTDLASCQDSNRSLQAEYNQASAALTTLRNDYGTLQDELEQLKARRGGTKKTARSH